jgi:hypothetical protein
MSSSGIGHFQLSRIIEIVLDQREMTMTGHRNALYLDCRPLFLSFSAVRQAASQIDVALLLQ